jgi:hypothetical protein
MRGGVGHPLEQADGVGTCEMMKEERRANEVVSRRQLIVERVQAKESERGGAGGSEACILERDVAQVAAVQNDVDARATPGPLDSRQNVSAPASDVDTAHR